MNQELMKQNLEEHRYQGSSLTENIITQGIANSTYENIVKNSLAKESSASFQMAMLNGGIYHNNALMGSSNLYGILRKFLPKGRVSESSNYFEIGPIQFNKFSAADVDVEGRRNLNRIAKKIADNNPAWNVETDVIPTGYGFQKKGYQGFFQRLDSQGFYLDKSVDPKTVLEKNQYRHYENYKKGKFKSAIGGNYEHVLGSNQAIDNYVNKEFGAKETELTTALDEAQKLAFDEKGEILDKDKVSEVKRIKTELDKVISEKKALSKELEDEKAAIDFYHSGKKWSSQNLADDMHSHLQEVLEAHVGKEFDLSKAEDLNKFNTFADDIGKLQKDFYSFGKSNYNQAYVDKVKEVSKLANKKRVTYYANTVDKNGKKLGKKRALIKIRKEQREIMRKYIKENYQNIVENFSKDVGEHFATKTTFQKLMGNNLTRFLSGVQSGMSAFLWQLPAIAVSTVASINQDNAIQNFISAHLYNPKEKDLYNSAGVNKSMQIATNVHISNLQDTQNIIIKHNTAERYLNDLDPMNVELDYSSKSFDLNPRNN